MGVDLYNREPFVMPSVASENGVGDAVIATQAQYACALVQLLGDGGFDFRPRRLASREIEISEVAPALLGAEVQSGFADSSGFPGFDTEVRGIRVERRANGGGPLGGATSEARGLVGGKAEQGNRGRR